MTRGGQYATPIVRQNGLFPQGRPIGVPAAGESAPENILRTSSASSRVSTPPPSGSVA
jgi:hypothetical protein